MAPARRFLLPLRSRVRAAAGVPPPLGAVPGPGGGEPLEGPSEVPVLLEEPEARGLPPGLPALVPGAEPPGERQGAEKQRRDDVRDERPLGVPEVRRRRGR